MSEPSLAVQALFRSRLTGSGTVVALVPATSIVDRNERPETFPCILLGEAQTVGDDLDCGASSVVYTTLHVWTREAGLRDCKRIAGAVRLVLRQAGGTVDGMRILDTAFEDARFLRDPSGEHAHGVVTFASHVEGA